MGGYSKTSFASKLRQWVHDEGHDEDYYCFQYDMCSVCFYRYHKDNVDTSFGYNKNGERYKLCVKCRAKAKTYRDADNKVEMVDGYVKCSACKCVYENIKTDFGFDRLGEQYKTCVTCRTKKKECRDKDLVKAREYDRIYYKQKHTTHKDSCKATGADNKPQHGKEIVPHFTDITGKKAIRLRYNINGMRYEKSMGYNKIGYEKAREYLEAWFKENVHSNQ